MKYIRSYQYLTHTHTHTHIYIYILLKFQQNFLYILLISSYRLNISQLININHNFCPIIWTFKTQP
jgi:hypothetical protein